MHVITSVIFFVIQGLLGKAGAKGAKGGFVSTVYQYICNFHESEAMFSCITSPIDSDKRDIQIVIINP